MANELKWFTHFRRVLQAMPETVEVTVHHNGSVEMHERGATLEYFNRVGDTDGVPTISSFQARNIIGKESGA